MLKRLSFRNKLFVGFGFIFLLMTLVSLINFLKFVEESGSHPEFADQYLHHATQFGAYWSHFASSKIAIVIGHLSGGLILAGIAFWLSHFFSEPIRKFIRKVDPLFSRNGITLNVNYKNESVILDQVASELGKAFDQLEKTNRLLERQVEERTRELAASEQKFRSMFNEVNIGVALHEIILDENGTPIDFIFLEVNPHYEQLTLLKRSEIIGKRGKEVIPNLEQKWIDRYGEVALSGQAIHVQDYSEYLNKHWDIKAFCPKKGQFAVAMSDISALKKADDLIKISEEKFRKAFITSPDAININRLSDGLFSSINRGFTTITGYTEEDVMGKTSLELDIWVDPADRKRLVEALKTQGMVENLEARFRSKSGSIKTGLMSASIIELEGILHVLSITRDITEWKRQEEELRDAESRYRMFIEQTTEGIYLMELDTPMPLNLSEDEMIDFMYDHAYLAECNLAYAHMYALESVTDMIGKRLLDFHGDKDNPINRDVHRQFIQKGFRISNEITEEIDTLGNLVYFRNAAIGIIENDQLVRYWGTQVDITDMKIKEAELLLAKERAEESDHLKSAFLANISHEIRTPLNGIMGFSDLLIDPETEEEDKIGYAKIIQNSGDLLLSILNNILSMSLLEAGQMITKYDQFPLKEFCNLIHKQTLLIIDNPRIQLIHAGAPEIEIETDRNQLTQVLNNLLSNAVKYTASGIIEFGSRIVGDHLEFYVKDSGKGIAAEIGNRIFERFYRVTDSAALQVPGSGLGLSLTKGIVENLGGTIWYKSNEGPGTSFFFTLPIIR